MNIIIQNSKLNFYLILFIFFIILFFPMSTNKSNKQYKFNKINVSNNLKQIVEHLIL